jgi:hypothetical protein
METIDVFAIILNVFELAAVIAGFIYWQKIKNSYWQWFPFLLLFIFITEIIAKTMWWQGSYRTSIPLLYKYINIPVMIVVFIWLMGKEHTKHKKNNSSTILIGLYVISFIVEELFFKKVFANFSSLSYQIGCVAILILAIISFLKLTNSNAIIYFKSNLHFWVSLGLILYLITTLPFMAFRNSLFEYNYNLGLQLWYVSMFFNVMMYTCFIVGFVLYKPEMDRIGKNPIC